MNLRILIVDDHKLFLEGIRQVISSIPDFTVAGTVHDIAALYHFLQNNKVDVILLDINIGKKEEEEHTGFVALRHIVAHHPHCKVMMVSGFREARIIKKAFDLGAHAYVLKESDRTTLEEGIRTIAEGNETYASMEVKNIIMDSLRSQRTVTEVKLTPRESEVLRLICQEYTTQEIAHKLYLSVNTIESHRKNLIVKTGVKNSVGLVRFAFDNGLI
jgi:two-component system nitrate/nitrite response regulator NarL